MSLLQNKLEPALDVSPWAFSRLLKIKEAVIFGLNQ
jgi:hypothetical protein